MAKTPGKVSFVKKLVRQLVTYHFPRKKITVNELGGGLTNHVFEALVGRHKLVIRISEERDKINFFHKEQWAVSRAREKKIPVPRILEVGNDIIPFPYMISEKLEGQESTHHPARFEILEEAGKIAALIHQIQTEGFGHIFDWSQNALSKKTSWQHYLSDEFRARERLDILRVNKLLPVANVPKILRGISKIEKWKGQPCLQHGDIRLKNIMVNKQGKIQALIDWEESISAVGPYWDLSIALHDLSIDAQQRFLRGYGLKGKDLLENAFALKVFNILNYTPVLEELLKNKRRNAEIIENYKARLHGAMDLFSI